MSKTDTVKLATAYRWDCPNCNHHNYADAISAPSDLVLEAARDELELEEWEDVPSQFDSGMFVTIPFDVTCQKCKVTFFAADPNEGNVEDGQ